MGFFDKLKQGLSKTKTSFDEKVNNIIGGFIRWLMKGCKTKLSNEINYDKNYHKNWACIICLTIIYIIFDSCNYYIWIIFYLI